MSNEGKLYLAEVTGEASRLGKGFLNSLNSFLLSALQKGPEQELFSYRRPYVFTLFSIPNAFPPYS